MPTWESPSGASPTGDLVACRSEVREVRGSSPRLVNVKKKKKKKIELQQILVGHMCITSQCDIPVCEVEKPAPLQIVVHMRRYPSP